MFQVEKKQVMPQLQQIPNVGFVWYVTPADEVTNFEQQPASDSEELVVREVDDKVACTVSSPLGETNNRR